MAEDGGALPSLAKLYAGAAATAARARLVRAEPFLTLPAQAVEVSGIRADPQKLTAFQHLVGKPARDVLPSGYVHALAFPVAMSVMVRDDFPLPLLGMIHLRNEVDHVVPIHFTEPLSIRSWARNLRGHRSGTQVEIVAEVRIDAGTTLAWRGVSTYLAKGVFLPGLDKPASAPARTDFRPPVPTAQWRLGVDTGRAYAAVSGDFNPIHLSVLSAKALGLRRSIAHGMYAAARVLADVRSPEPDTFSWEISFEAPIFLPATVSVRVADRPAANVAGDAAGAAVGVAAAGEDGSTPERIDPEGPRNAAPGQETDWNGTDFVAWSARTGRRHFSGCAVPMKGPFDA